MVAEETRETRKQRNQLNKLLLSFRRAYLVGGQDLPSSETTAQIEELTRNLKHTPIAQRAGIYLADYYFTLGDSEKSLGWAVQILDQKARPPIHYAANMICGANQLRSKKPEEAAQYYRDAALAADTRDGFSAAYDGLEMSVVVMARMEWGSPSKPYFPTCLVDDIHPAIDFWKNEANLYVDPNPWRKLGDWGSVHLVLPTLSPGESPENLPRQDAVMGIVQDRGLCEKRSSVGSDDPFEFVVPCESQPVNWHPDAKPAKPIIDPWHNQVIFANEPSAEVPAAVGIAVSI
jgi:hypothetical protein